MALVLRLMLITYLCKMDKDNIVDEIQVDSKLLSDYWNESKEERDKKNDKLQLKKLRAAMENDILEQETAYMNATTEYNNCLRKSQKTVNSKDLHKWWLKQKESKFLFNSITEHYKQLFGENPRIQ